MDLCAPIKYILHTLHLQAPSENKLLFLSLSVSLAQHFPPYMTVGCHGVAQPVYSPQTTAPKTLLTNSQYKMDCAYSAGYISVIDMVCFCLLWLIKQPENQNSVNQYFQTLFRHLCQILRENIFWAW